MLRSPKFNEETKEHVRVKKVNLPKNGTSIYDFMLHPPNDKSQVVDSPLLTACIPKVEAVKCNNRTCKATQVELELVEKLLEKNIIKGYNLSYLSDNKPDIFLLTRASPSHCLLCD